MEEKKMVTKKRKEEEGQGAREMNLKKKTIHII